MTKETVLEVLNKIIGEIKPVADSGIDADRFENLKLFLDVFDEMHTMIDDIAYYNKDTKFGSVKPFVNECNKMLDRIGIPKD